MTTQQDLTLEERQRQGARRTASFIAALAVGIFLLTLYLNI